MPILLIRMSPEFIISKIYGPGPDRVSGLPSNREVSTTVYFKVIFFKRVFVYLFEL
jgi:hypothetical protein